MSLPAPYSEVYLAGDGVTTEFAFGTDFTPISAELVKCSIYLQDGYEIIPTYTVDMTVGSITISALTLQDNTVLTAPPIGSTVRIYRDEPEAQNVTASQLQAFTAKQLERALDAIVAMIQEVSYTTDHKTIRLTEPQRDIALQELGGLEDGHLIYWDNTARKLVVTNYPQQDVVRCVNGLFFRLRTNPNTNTPYLQWSTDNSDWHSIDVDSAYALANDAYTLADSAYNLASTTRGELNAHKADHNNPHETSMAKLIDTNFNNLVSGQFLQFNGINWVNVDYNATVTWGGIGGSLENQADLKAALDGKVEKAGDTMTGALNIADIASSNTPLLTLTHSSTATYKWNIAPRYNSTTLSVYPGSTETNGFRFATTGFVPASNNARYLGSASLKWKGVYTAMINNGYDIAVPVTSSPDTLALKSDVDLAANSGRMITDQGVWYAKMYAATVVPTGAEYDGKNYADFSQVDADNNPVIKIYTGVSGAWTLSETITPPAEYDGYVPITSKIWDIAEQSGQQGGRILWNHQSKEFTPSPQIISFEDINVTGNSTVDMPQNPGTNQIVNKNYVDEAIASIPTPTVDVAQSIDAEIVGTLTITDNSVVSGFSENDYLKFPGVFKLGDAESFEIAGSFISANSNSVVLRGCEPGSTQTQGVYISVAKVGGDSFLRVTVYHSATLGDYQTIDGITALQTNTEYYFKFEYSLADSLYKIWLSTDGETYTLERSVSVTKLPGESVFINGSNYPITSVNMSDWAITKNGQMIWAGMDAPGLHQRVATGHEVVEFQAPTSTNNYTWYRKYADGWVEMGGLAGDGGTTNQNPRSVVFPVTMANTNYQVLGTPKNTTDNAATFTMQPRTLSTTGMDVYCTYCARGDSGPSGETFYWQVSGMVAS